MEVVLAVISIVLRYKATSYTRVSSSTKEVLTLLLFDRAFVNGAFKGRLARPNEWRIAQNSRVFLVMR